MREIKFRAYIKEVNKNYPCCVSQHRTDDGSNIAFVEGRDYVDGFNCNIMQYTGLKDKNGKEIYEGDIIKNIDVTVCDSIGVVTFEDGMFQTNIDWNDGHHCIGHGVISKYSLECSIEVIGNIYENQELLKGSDYI